MKQLFTIIFLLLFILDGSVVTAQRVVEVPNTPSDPADLYATIMGDTTNSGDRVDENTIYELENGGVYVISDRIRNIGWPLQIHAKNLENTALKPFITRIPTNDGSYKDIARPEGDVSFLNLWLVLGEKGPAETHDWGKLRILKDSVSVTIKDCILEKDRGGMPQLRANGVKLYLENNIFRNAGNRRMLQGNGRGIDARDFQVDSLVVKNCVFHNLQDRVCRSQGATGAHNYIEFDHNTIFNQMGRHGCIQIGFGAKTAKITNNVFSNPIMWGSSEILRDEQTQVDKDSHFVVTIDGEDVATDFTFDNNNIFWTQDVLDYYASNDTVSQAGIYSKEIVDKLGGVSIADTTYFTEVLEFNKVPARLTQYLKDMYADPTSTEMFDLIAEDASRDGTDWDTGNIFDFSTFSVGYDENSTSFTAASDGGAVGARLGGFGVPNPNVTSASNTVFIETAVVYPNPSYGNVTFRYNLQNSDLMKISILDMNGREISIVDEGKKAAGNHSLTLNLDNFITENGIYFAQLMTINETKTIRLIYLR